MDSGTLVHLNASEWECIFKSLEMARQVFATNPVLQDIMMEEARDHFILDISSIMDKIGFNGKEAHLRGIAPK